MGKNSSQYRNIVLISQIGISIMVPVFLCLALGLWLDKRFGTWFTVPLLIIGIAAGARNAYVLAMNTVRADERRRKKEQEDHINEILNRKTKDDNEQ